MVDVRRGGAWISRIVRHPAIESSIPDSAVRERGLIACGAACAARVAYSYARDANESRESSSYFSNRRIGNPTPTIASSKDIIAKLVGSGIIVTVHVVHPTASMLPLLTTLGWAPTRSSEAKTSKKVVVYA